MIGLARGAKIVRIERAVGIDDLREAQAHDLARGAAHPQADAPNHVLSQVIYPYGGGPDG